MESVNPKVPIQKTLGDGDNGNLPPERKLMESILGREMGDKSKIKEILVPKAANKGGRRAK